MGLFMNCSTSITRENHFVNQVAAVGTTRNGVKTLKDGLNTDMPITHCSGCKNMKIDRFRFHATNRSADYAAWSCLGRYKYM